MENPQIDILKNENLLRDYIANNIHFIDKNLTTISTEYTVYNKNGSNGRIDILAKDESGKIVVIEIKRSNKTSRELITELSKYIKIIIDDEKISETQIKCIVISTHWHEIEAPLSHFYEKSGVDIEAISVVIEENNIIFQKKEILPANLLPNLSPEIVIHHYNSASDLERHINKINTKAKLIPFVRVAAIKDTTENSSSLIRAIFCIWKIDYELHTEIETVIGKKFGSLAPYAFPDSEAECDTLDWLLSETEGLTLFLSAELERGTPEKVSSIAEKAKDIELSKIGSWPINDEINNITKIIADLEATSALLDTNRYNRHKIEFSLRTIDIKSWEISTRRFLDYISFNETWRHEAEIYLNKICKEDKTIYFQALDKRNFFYSLYQATEHKNADLSSFTIYIKDENNTIERGITGTWSWNGKTCPRKVGVTMNRVYGSAFWCISSNFNAVDTQRYESAYDLHGFSPAVFEISRKSDNQPLITPIYLAHQKMRDLHEFARKNKKYMKSLHKIFNIFAAIPTDPRDSNSNQPIFLEFSQDLEDLAQKL